MNRMTAITALSSAIGLAVALSAPLPAASAEMPQIVKDNMARMAKDHLEKCYGINAVSRNDCAEGAHSCAGQATKARDRAAAPEPAETVVPYSRPHPTRANLLRRFVLPAWEPCGVQL
jgi:uncharacterized membrane protein